MHIRAVSGRIGRSHRLLKVALILGVLEIGPNRLVALPVEFLQKLGRPFDPTAEEVDLGLIGQSEVQPVVFPCIYIRDQAVIIGVSGQDDSS